MVMTKFHFMLLYKEHLVGICNLNEKTTYEVPLVSGLFPPDVAQFLNAIPRLASKCEGLVRILYEGRTGYIPTSRFTNCRLRTRPMMYGGSIWKKDDSIRLWSTHTQLHNGISSHPPRLERTLTKVDTSRQHIVFPNHLCHLKKSRSSFWTLGNETR